MNIPNPTAPDPPNLVRSSSPFPVFDRLRKERDDEKRRNAPAIPSDELLNDSGTSVPR